MSQPLVSIFCFCKNRAASIQRCVESVLNQTYSNLEFVIQDGASTDGTLEIIKRYADPRIKLVSEPDAGHHEAFLKGMRRCQGEIIGSCLSDEELLPHAVEEAVALFDADPAVGAITRDGYNTDPGGNIVSEFIAGEFDFVGYLFGRYCPMWVASFFRRRALLEIGLEDEGWAVGAIEFQTWCRLATRSRVKYVPGIVAKYGVDAEGQLSNSPAHINFHLEHRTRVIEELFSADGFFGDDKAKKFGCLYNQNFLFYNHARIYRMFDVMKLIYGRIVELKQALGAAAPEYGMYFSDIGAGGDTVSVMQARSEAYGKAWRAWLRASTKFPRFVKQMLSREQRAAIQRAGMMVLYYANVGLAGPRSTRAADPVHAHSDDAMYGLAAPTYSKRLYHDAACLFYGRGNIDYAQFLWRRAEPLNDVDIDSIAVQAALMSPTATHESLLAGQQRWAERHARALADLPPIRVEPYRGNRKIRVGYFCSFFDGYVVRAMFLPVVQSRDREKFHVTAYSTTPAAPYMEQAFDEFKVVGTMPDRDFVQRVREDRIDIFVEMSGFSPYNRYAAMASRCAPVQIAYFNHSGTCGTPNVDYVLADDISVAREDEAYYTEKVWRLEGDFLFFNYEWANLPEPGEPPCLRNGYVTFGCFGSGTKLSDEIVEIWAELLRRVPRSRMYVRNGPLGRRSNRDYLAQRFARHGVPADRLRLDGAVDWPRFIKSYEEVDISLDTWPYCGANTIGESIWQGVPVVTLLGKRFSSRYGASHVTAAGTPELVARSPRRYVDIAAELAADPARLSNYRRNLRRMSKEHGLSDPVRFARKLENAYVEMMDLQHCGRD